MPSRCAKRVRTFSSSDLDSIATFLNQKKNFRKSFLSMKTTSLELRVLELHKSNMMGGGSGELVQKTF